MDPKNPYAAPKAAIDAPVNNLRVDYYEEDGCLVIRKNSRLPPLCVGTGEPAEADLKTRTIRHIQTWTIWTVIFLSPLIGLILMFTTQRLYPVTFAVSERARARRKAGILTGIGVMVAAAALWYLAITIRSGMLILVAVFATWAAIFVLVARGQPYRVRKADGDYVYLQLHADALYAFEQYRQQHMEAPAPVAARPSNPHSPF